VHSLGVIVVGDYAVSVGADAHVPFVRAALAAAGGGWRIAWAWLVAADPVAVAAALHEAQTRPHPVVCFGGLGDGCDDHVRAALAALERGRADVGLPARALADAGQGALTWGNVTCFAGSPERAHPAFRAWWQTALTDTQSAGNTVRESIRWCLPESALHRKARCDAARRHSDVRQYLATMPDGTPALVFVAPSRGKAQAARKAVQAQITSMR